MSNKPEVVLTRGLPGCGKSTWAKQLVEDGLGKWKRVNKDDLRAMIDNSHWNKHNEEFVLKVRNFVILEAVKKGYSVVVDDTNFGKHFDEVKKLVEGYATVRVQDFTDVPLQTCIERDLKRLNSVGKDVIMGMYNRYLNPSKDYELMQLEHNPKLPNCIIVDVDGTVAKMHGNRGPFEWDKVDTDLPSQVVIDTVNAFKDAKDCKMFVVSGRDGICWEKTEKWLKDHGVNYDHLYMRGVGDMRPDNEVKKEIFYQNFSGRWNVLACFDDRPKVIRMWRQEIGLFVFQVNDMEF